MARFPVRAGVSRGAATVAIGIAVSLAGAFSPVPARADAVAYLVNVTVRPGYNFANPDAALGYGHGVCDKVGAKAPYAELMQAVKADFHTSNEYQASYLIIQAVNELCPAQIWQLRNSAVHYRIPVS